MDGETDVARFYFDRGIWAFGRHVERRLDEVTNSTQNETLAAAAREREWERLMGADMTASTTGFANPAESVPAKGKLFLDEDAAPSDMFDA